MKVYYAHCMAIYGTPQEDRDIATLRRLGFEDILNPNAREHQTGYADFVAAGKPGMDYFTRLVDTCDAVVFRANPDGSIPAGVAKEVAHAVAHEKPVMELPSAFVRRTLTVMETREYLKECGQR